MMEKIVHTAKQTVKAMVDMDKRPRRRRGPGSTVVEWTRSFLRSMVGVGGAALWLKTKKLPARSLASVHPGSRSNLIGSFAWMRPPLDAESRDPSVGLQLTKQEACQFDAFRNYRIDNQ